MARNNFGCFGSEFIQCKKMGNGWVEVLCYVSSVWLWQDDCSYGPSEWSIDLCRP